MTRPRRRPTRRDLLVVIGRLQHAIGAGLGAYGNDRDPDRAGTVERVLRPAFDLAIEALGHEPPLEPFGPWAAP